ncbi:MAG: MBL fold metallo-hydrolase [Bacteroidota bacterium]
MADLFDGWQEREPDWRIRLDKTFQDQLAQVELSLQDFDFHAYSHFDFDHIGVANEVEGATLIMQRGEYDAAFSDSASVFGYTPELYSTLKEGEQIIIDGEHDVFVDASVRLLPAFGHTPGHQVLYVELPQTGPVILAGDLYVFRVGREQRRVLPIDNDSNQSIVSMERLEKFIEDTGSTLWIGHDMAQYNQAETAADVLTIH